MALVPELSVFIPVHNEEANLRQVAEGILTTLSDVSERFELLIVDDGSTDATPKLADELAAGDSNVRVVHHATNRGYGSALRTGLYNCRYALIAFIDGDGQFDFAEISDFLPHVHASDLTIGYRPRRQDDRWRLFNAEAWGALIRLLFGLHVRDIDCAFKLLHRERLWTLPRLRSDGAMISAELLVRARNAGWTLNELPVSHYRRRTEVQMGANPKVILFAFRDLFRLWRALRVSSSTKSAVDCAPQETPGPAWEPER